MEENQDWKDQIPELDHMHRFLHPSIQGNMEEPDAEARKDPRRWYDQMGSEPVHPKEDPGNKP